MDIYRIRIFDGEYELLTDQRHLMPLDLDTPAGLAKARIDLDGMFTALSTVADYRTERSRRLHLRIDNQAGRHVCDHVPTAPCI